MAIFLLLSCCNSKNVLLSFSAIYSTISLTLDFDTNNCICYVDESGRGRTFAVSHKILLNDILVANK